MTVLTARAGEEALRVLQRERVDLIVSDFRMPGWTASGRHRVPAPRAPRPRARCAPCSPPAGHGLARRAQEEAVRAALATPVDSGQLVRMTRRLIAASG